CADLASQAVDLTSQSCAPVRRSPVAALELSRSARANSAKLAHQDWQTQLPVSVAASEIAPGELQKDHRSVWMRRHCNAPVRRRLPVNGDAVPVGSRVAMRLLLRWADQVRPSEARLRSHAGSPASELILVSPVCRIAA